MLFLYLLQLDPWGNIPTWVQAICAIITLIISISILILSFKIKTLTDVVSELSNHTNELKSQSESMRNMYELSLEQHYASTIPKLKFLTLIDNNTFRFQCELLNATARINRIDAEETVILKFHSNIGVTMNAGDKVEMRFDVLNTKLFHSSNAFAFYIVFQREDDKLFLQHGRVVRGPFDKYHLDFSIPIPLMSLNKN